MSYPLLWCCLYTNPVEDYPHSHWARVPARLLSHLGYFIERSCSVTQGEMEGEEANTEMSLVCYFFFFYYCFFPLFSPPHPVTFTLDLASQCIWVAMDPHHPHSPFYFLLSSAISPSWSHLLLKPVTPQPPPKINTKPSTGYGTSAPTTGVELCMVGSSETKDSLQPRPWPTLPPVALSIPCDIPVCVGRCTHVYI